MYRRSRLEPTDIKSICLDVQDNICRFIVCACYRWSGKCKEQDFLASLFTSAEAMYNSRKELLLLGDFNMDLYNNTAEARAPNSHLVDFCERFRLVNNIPEPTRVTSTTKRLIDVALTSNLERFSTSGTLQLGFSDQDFFATHLSVKLAGDRDTLVNFNFVPVSSSYVSTILHNLDSKKAVGVYGISSFFLRLSAPGIVDEITKLINFFINSQSWPQEWKCSIVTFSFGAPSV